MLYSFIALNRNHAFPGFWALLPVTGALLIIIAGPEAWANRLGPIDTSRMARKPDPPHPKTNQGLHLRPKLRDLRAGECPRNSTDQTGDAKTVDTAHTSGAPAVHDYAA